MDKKKEKEYRRRLIYEIEKRNGFEDEKDSIEELEDKLAILSSGNVPKDSHSINLSEKVENEYFRVEDKDKSLSSLSTEHFLYCDGGSRGNPGIAGSGFVILREDKYRICEKAQYCGIGSNNEAEYLALVLGLKECVERGLKNVVVKMDSLLVVKQMNKEWKLKAENLKPYNSKAHFYASKIPKIKFMHIRRELNTCADEQSNIAMDISEKGNDIKNPLEVLQSQK